MNPPPTDLPEKNETLLDPDSSVTTETPVAPDVSVAQMDQDETSILDAETATALQSRSTGRSVARATAGIMPLQFSRLLMGFITQPLIGHIFGLGNWRADSYTVSLNIQEKIWLIFEKVVNPAVLPCFMRALDEEGEERAWRFTSTVISLTAVALFVATLLAWALMPQIVMIYSIKTAAYPERLQLTVTLARLMLAGLCF